MTVIEPPPPARQDVLAPLLRGLVRRRACRCGSAPGTAAEAGPADAPPWCCAPGGRCAGCCGARASWAWPRLRHRRARRRGRPGRRAARGSGARWRADPAPPAGPPGARPSGRSLRLGWARSAPAGPARLAGPAHRRACTAGAGTAPRSATTTTCPTSSTRCCWTSRWPTPARYYERRPDVHPRRGPARQARPDLPQARPAARHAAARRRLRLGLAGAARRRALRRAGHRRHPLRRAAATSSSADRRARPGRPGRGPAAGLPRRSPTARSTRSRSIEMGEHVGDGQLPAYAAALHRLVRPGRPGAASSRCRGGPAAPGGGAVHRDLHRPRHAHAPGRRDLALLEAAGLEIRDVQALREHYVRTVRELARHLRVPLRRRRRAGRRGGGPGLAALPGRWRAGLRARAGWASTRSWPCGR